MTTCAWGRSLSAMFIGGWGGDRVLFRPRIEDGSLRRLLGCWAAGLLGCWAAGLLGWWRGAGAPDAPGWPSHLQPPSVPTPARPQAGVRLAATPATGRWS